MSPDPAKLSRSSDYIYVDNSPATLTDASGLICDRPPRTILPTRPPFTFTKSEAAHCLYLLNHFATRPLLSPVTPCAQSLLRLFLGLTPMPKEPVCTRECKRVLRDGSPPNYIVTAHLVKLLEQLRPYDCRNRDYRDITLYDTFPVRFHLPMADLFAAFFRATIDMFADCRYTCAYFQGKCRASTTCQISSALNDTYDFCSSLPPNLAGLPGALAKCGCILQSTIGRTFDVCCPLGNTRHHHTVVFPCCEGYYYTGGDLLGGLQ